MSAYYSEHDPEKAHILRQLITDGQIAPGDVDERSIEDVTPAELVGYTQRHFFAGGGIWSLALRGAGWPDAEPVDTMSCPCQPHSAAASDRKRGFDDPRDLWPVARNFVRFVPLFGEQVDDSSAWIDRMHSDLESAGFAIGATDFPACAADAPIERMRTYFVAIPHGAGFSQQGWSLAVAPELVSVERSGRRTCYGNYATTGELGKRRRHEYGTALLADGPAGRVSLLRLAGDAIVLPQAQAFIEAARGVMESL